MAEAITILGACWKLASAISDALDRVEQTREDGKALKFLEQKARKFLGIINQGLAGCDASPYIQTIASLQILLKDIFEASTRYAQMSDMNRFLYSANTKRIIQGLDERLRLFTEAYLIQSTTQMVRGMLTFNARSRVYFDISINGKQAGRMIFMLWDDIAPRTTRNFRELAAGYHGFGYQGSTFDCVRKRTWIRGGTISGERYAHSIYGKAFKREWHDARVSKTAILDMSPSKGTIGSYFCINPDTTCDWRTAFGEVLEGMDVLQKMISKTIKKPKTTKSCTKSCIHPKDKFVIAGSGIIN